MLAVFNKKGTQKEFFKFRLNDKQHKCLCALV